MGFFRELRRSASATGSVRGAKRERGTGNAKEKGRRRSFPVTKKNRERPTKKDDRTLSRDPSNFRYVEAAASKKRRGDGEEACERLVERRKEPHGMMRAPWERQICRQREGNERGMVAKRARARGKECLSRSELTCSLFRPLICSCCCPAGFEGRPGHCGTEVRYQAVMHQQTGQAKHALEHAGGGASEPLRYDGGRGRVQRDWKEDDVLRLAQKTVVGTVLVATCQAQVSQSKRGILCERS
eukprot:scaffold348_cov329-Pavlova_lutheri.AAC.46